MTALIRRGSRLLTGDDLGQHLERILRLENVGVLLGAGASKPIGGQTMAEVWAAFLAKEPSLAEWLTSRNFLNADGTLGVHGVEGLIDTLAVAEREWTRGGHAELQQLRESAGALRRQVVSAALLVRDWWKSGYPPPEQAELSDHRKLLLRLLASRQPGQSAPWLFTLNYDLALEWAAESIGVQLINGFSGLHQRVFSPHHFDLGLRSVAAKGEAQFGAYYAYLAKLHGSLTWRLAETGQVEEQPALAAWSGIQSLLETPTQDGADHRSLLVLPSVLKYEQTVGFLLGELMRRFAEFLARPQTALLVVGYSFGDEHINRLLLSGLQNPTLQLVIYRPELEETSQRKLADPARCRFVERMLDLEMPHVTFKGPGEEGYLAAAVRDLPEPTLLDQDAQLFRRLRSLAHDTGGAGPVPSEPEASK